MRLRLEMNEFEVQNMKDTKLTNFNSNHIHDGNHQAQLKCLHYYVEAILELYT